MDVDRRDRIGIDEAKVDMRRIVRTLVGGRLADLRRVGPLDEAGEFALKGLQQKMPVFAVLSDANRETTSPKTLQATRA